MTQLNDLNTRLQPIESFILEAAIPCSLQSLLEICAPSLLQTEHTRTSLVQVLNKRDVEVGDICAQADIHVGQRGAVRAVDLDGSAGQGPLRAVGNVGCFVDVGACDVSEKVL